MDSNQRQRRLFESGMVGMIHWTTDGRVTDANDRFLEMVGYTRDDLMAGRIDWLNITPPEFRHLDAASVAELKATGTNRRPFEKVYVRKDGSRMPIIVAGAMLDEERIEGVAFVLDIADRKRAEESLRESEARYRLLYSQSKEAIMVMSPEEGFLAGNPATLKMFNCRDESEFVGRTPEDFSPKRQPDGRFSREAAADMIRQALSGGTNYFEWVHRRTDGTDFPATVLLSKLDDGGKVVLQATVRDVTDHKQAEAERDRLEGELRQAQKMEAIGRLAGGVAHDFNNLLTVIRGSASVALEHVSEGPAIQCLHDVEEAGRRATEVTAQLLAFSRKQLIEPRVLDLHVTVSKAVRMLERLLGEGIPIETALAPDLWRIKADPTQFEQILLNLAVNARDAMPGGGRLSIKACNVPADDSGCGGPGAAAPTDYVVVSVTDSGLGIDSATREHLFEPFFTTKPQGQGTGLGLSTVYGIVKQHGGAIEVESVPTRGTTFKIYLPRAEGDAWPSAPSVEEGALPTGNETLLLVEDDDSVAAITQWMLAPLGYRLLTASSGEAALEIGRTHAGPIHLLVTDVIMPCMYGTELALKFGEIRPETRVLFVSGYTESEIARDGTLKDGVHFLGKPYSRRSLAAKVRAVLDGVDGQIN